MWQDIPCLIKVWSFEGEKCHWINKDYLLFAGKNTQDNSVKKGKIIEHALKINFQDIF